MIGSSGVEYALARHWSNPAAPNRSATVAQAQQTPVIAGSRARATELQVEHAIGQGFAEVRVDPAAIASGEESASERERLAYATVAAMSTGRNVVMHTPVKLPTQSINGTTLARALRLVVARVTELTTVRRMIVAGGDTPAMIARAIGIRSLEIIAPFDPGAPLCRSKGETPGSNGLEICLEAGQIGDEDYFVRIAEAGLNRHQTRERVHQ